ncbi:hypothetical protein F0562_003925 [Nyssa sinensis]|uniref:Uncharacterized protein n=1 Tax=Nyssa sinensis TaxID=561372 RepID=A0A5J5BXX9_9ASTE|nr:hypothetical protein F0562_003925 [Nyssa sinensis]
MNGRVAVVEYLEESMSTELLCKFPDNGAFDFDYSQSSIWSPLVSSRLFPPVVSFQLGDGHGNGLSLTMPPIELGPSTQRERKLSYDDEENGLLLENNNISTLINKVTAKIKKKISTCVLNNLNNNYIKLKEKRKNKPFDFCPNPLPVKAAPTIPTPTKGWAKVLKATSRQLKKKNKKKELSAHIIKLSNCLRYGNF